MKAAITSTGEDLQSGVDPRFGRARWFVVVDTESDASEALDNEQNLNAMQGAGVQAAQNVSEAGVEAVITGNVGPKAFSVLGAAGIKIYTGATGTVADALEAFKAGKLEAAGGANVESHWTGS